MSHLAQPEVVLDCQATTTAGGGDAAADPVEKVGLQVEEFSYTVDSKDRPWFTFAKGEWGQVLPNAWMLAPVGWTSTHLLNAEDAPVLTGMDWPDAHDLSFCKNETTLYHSDGPTDGEVPPPERSLTTSHVGPPDH
eukprot:8605700-Pyramimonas_sp.AAC.1